MALKTMSVPGAGSIKKGLPAKLKQPQHIYWLAIILWLLLVVGSFAWAAWSLYLARTTAVGAVWFSRSGAILVLAAFISSLIHKPLAADYAAPDLVENFEAAIGEREGVSERSWLAKHLPKLLASIELAMGTVGTLIWAYGDTWLTD